MRTDLEQPLREAFADDAERARLLHPDEPPAPEARPLLDAAPPRRSRRGLVAVAAAIALITLAVSIVVQKGDGEPNSPSTPGPTHVVTGDPDTQARVDRAVLTAEQMPEGWTSAPPEVAEAWSADREALDRGVADCLGTADPDLEEGLAAATSAFVNTPEPNDERVVSEVTAFASETDAREVVDRYRDDVAQQCYLDAIEQQIARGAAREGLTTISGRELSVDEIQIGDSTATEVLLEHLSGGSYRDLGSNAVGLRFRVPLSSEGIDVDVYVVAVFVAKGRFLVETSFQTYFMPFDGGMTTVAMAPQAVVLLTKLMLNRIPPGA